MNIMTKRGNVDNIVTYEHICDTRADMEKIDQQYITLGSVCIVLAGTDGSLEVYMSNSQKEWKSIMDGIGGGNTGDNALQETIQNLVANNSAYWGNGDTITCNGLTISQTGSSITLNGSTDTTVYVKIDGELVANTDKNEILELQKTRRMAYGSSYYFDIKEASFNNGTYTYPNTPYVPKSITLYIQDTRATSIYMTLDPSQNPPTHFGFGIAVSNNPTHNYMLYLEIPTGVTFEDYTIQALAQNRDNQVG